MSKFSDCLKELSRGYLVPQLRSMLEFVSARRLIIDDCTKKTSDLFVKSAVAVVR